MATAWIAAVDDERHVSFGRALAAWIGLVPRQNTTGGTFGRGGIGKRITFYRRHQLGLGAGPVLIRRADRSDRQAKWARK